MAPNLVWNSTVCDTDLIEGYRTGTSTTAQSPTTPSHNIDQDILEGSNSGCWYAYGVMGKEHTSSIKCTRR
eukprot:scaffold36188_cov54-Attheya_sp.AAC.5